jgi:hypothetical protein
MTTVTGRCALCHEIRDLRESHIVPKLVARWIKKDEPGTLFQNLESGKVRQDISRKRLLCDECEQRFSKFEGPFRERILDPYLRGESKFPRGEWLTRFATSLAFRVGVVTLPSVDVGPPERRAKVEAVLEAWRLYLLAPDGAAPPSEHELLFLNGRNMIPPRDIPPDQTGRYLSETIDPTVVASPNVLGVYSKLPAMLFWAPIEPTDRAGWRGTRVSGTGPIRANKQNVSAPVLTQLVQSRVRAVAATGAFEDDE